MDNRLQTGESARLRGVDDWEAFGLRLATAAALGSAIRDKCEENFGSDIDIAHWSSECNARTSPLRALVFFAFRAHVFIAEERKQ